MKKNSVHCVHCVHTVHKNRQILSTQSIVCTWYHRRCTRVAPEIGKATQIVNYFFLYFYIIKIHLMVF
jgi:ribosomal protein L44E